ncbi:spermatogenesis-defective protein 39 homolog isoform X2 [Stigmatopora argus]
MLKSRSDEEDYWNTNKFQAFTFDDEDDELRESKAAVSSLPRLTADDDDDDDDHGVEKVSWSGEPVGSISWSVRETATARVGGADAGAGPVRVPGDSAKVNTGYLLGSLFKGRKNSAAPVSAEAWSQAAGRTWAPEIRLPKSHKPDLAGDRSPREVVDRMRRGKAASLEPFRCLSEKMELLDSAVAAHDGDVVTAVLIFLKKSLSQEVLFGQLASRRTALMHFVNYLSESGQRRLLLELYRSLGRREDAALLQYREHLGIADGNERRDFLNGCLSLSFSPEDRAHVRDQMALLERQMLLEAADAEAQRSGKAEIFQKYPRKASVLHLPLVTTLYYCCFYHYERPEGSSDGPAELRRSFKISDKQFLVTALSALAKRKSWSHVDALFTRRSWLGFTRKKSPLSFRKVVEVLHRNGAPSHVLQDYVGLVEDVDARLALARKHKCHDLVIETYRELKERRPLQAYRGQVEAGSAQERKIDELLGNAQIRWKN